MKAASLAQFLLFIHAAGGNISKCIRKDDTISFNCPEGHVVYQPTIFVGKSTSNTCTHGPGDCTGMTYELKLQRQKCFWQKKCSFRWRDQQPIMSSNNTQCLMEMPNYVSFENPVCVSSGHVFDVCSDPDLTSVTHGVIRSHPDYPWNYQATSQHCKVTLPAKHGRRLVVTVDDVDVDVADGDIVVIRKLSLKSGAELFINPAKKGDRIDSNYTAKIEVIYTVRAKTHAGEKKGNGFILRFEYSSSQTTQQPNNQHSLTSHNLFTNSLFNVFGAVEECITPKREKINITCPEGHVIFKPEVKVGVSTDGRCFNKLGDCVGLTYTFLTQKNVCYWKESCEFSWRTGVPITMSQSLRCLSLPPKYISVSGYSCIEEEKVIELCDKDFFLVNKTAGILKSHSEYPWHYKAVKRSCRKRIRVPKNGVLRMRSRDIDLDPDVKGDNIKIYHINQKRKVLRQKVRGSTEIDESFTGGCVEINFRISQNTKAGRGFVIQFEAQTASSRNLELDDCETRRRTKNRRKNRKNKKKNIRNDGSIRKRRRNKKRRRFHGKHKLRKREER